MENPVSASTVDPQVVDVINQVQLATMSPQVVMTSGAGKAYQAVAQSSAIAIQDAADALRNLSTISTTAVGVAMAQLLATGEPKYVTVLQQAQAIMSSATADFGQISSTASALLKEFPAG
jgi:hypothetical protein